MNIRRKKILESLVAFECDIESIRIELSEFPWDFDDELVIIKRMHVIRVMWMYLNNLISDKDIEKWANVVESRDDIGYDASSKHNIKKVVFELANPLLAYKLTPETARQIIRKMDVTIP